MRLVAVSIVKNEADIIEAFVRHTLAWVDHHLIFDHDSTDGTRQILRALRAEGLPLTLFTDNALGNLQQARSNHLTRLAVNDHAADWVLPLDADEIFTGPSRAALEEILSTVGPQQPASLFLLNYYPTEADDASIANPVLRLRHCQTSPVHTKKIIIPRHLALEPEVAAGKGSHVLYRGAQALSDQPLPADFHLCHLALRSPQHQVLRVVLAELQKLSRGQAHAGLDVHYRLGFQLLAEDPDLFFSTVYPPLSAYRLQPIEYRGTALKPGLSPLGWNRVAQALLPYLEKLAISHGRLTDQSTALSPSTDKISSEIFELPPEETLGIHSNGIVDKFSGFEVRSGWGPQEGPVPEAFLPVFHWSYGPVTELVIRTDHAGEAHLHAEGLTYSENQTVEVELNGLIVLRHTFSRINQKETIAIPLSLHAGENRLALHYSQSLVTDHDARQLAVIFVSFRILFADSR